MYKFENLEYDFFSETKNRLFLVDIFSNLHFRNLPLSKYTIIGINAIKIFYFSILTSKNINLFVAKNKDSEIIGFLISSNKEISISKLILLNLLKHKFLDINLILKLINLDFLKKIILFIIQPSFPLRYEKEKKYSQILSIIVDNEYQGRGIAKIMFNNFYDFCKKNAFNKIISITTSYQTNAVYFYNSIQVFKLVKKVGLDSGFVRLVYVADVL